MNEAANVPWEQTAASWDLASTGYEEHIAPRNEPFADDLIALVSPAPGSRFLDVACGTGIVALRAARAGCAVVAVDFAPGMIALLERAAQSGGLHVDVRVMDGQQLAFADASFDVGASLFGLQLFADRAAGLRELRRVIAVGGTVAIGAWAGPERVELLTPLLRALSATVPGAPVTGQAPLIYSMADPQQFRAELAAAGFRDIVLREFDHPFTFTDAAAYWRLLESAAPAPIERIAALPPPLQRAVRAALTDDLRASFGSGPIILAAAARIAVARVA